MENKAFNKHTSDRKRLTLLQEQFLSLDAIKAEIDLLQYEIDESSRILLKVGCVVVLSKRKYRMIIKLGSNKYALCHLSGQISSSIYSSLNKLLTQHNFVLVASSLENFYAQK